MQITNYWRSFVSILFPPLCAGCGQVLLQQEKILCTDCQYHLPVNDHYLFKNNQATQRLLGKADVDMAAAYLSFSKSSRVQTLVHKLKYEGMTDIGFYLGECFGKQLLSSNFFPQIDYIVPVPLHLQKQKKRGYNQSEYLAKGLAATLGIPMDTMLLRRIVNTDTQTHKSKIARYDNMEDVFTCNSSLSLEGKYILLVDDVLTTGATIASAARTLTEQTRCKVYVAVLAIA